MRGRLALALVAISVHVPTIGVAGRPAGGEGISLVRVAGDRAEARVARAGTWAALAPEARIGSGDLILVPSRSSATVQAPGGPVEIAGLFLASGEMLASSGRRTAAQRFFGVTRASGDQALETGHHLMRIHRTKGAEEHERPLLNFAGKEEKVRISSSEFAERDLISGNLDMAIERARHGLKTGNGPVDGRLAHLVLAHGLFGRESLAETLAHLEAVVAAPPGGLEAKDSVRARSYRVGGLVLRAVIRYGSGDREAASSDLQSAVSEFSRHEDRPNGADLARLLLAAIAIEKGEREVARTLVGEIANERHYYDSGDSIAARQRAGKELLADASATDTTRPATSD